jgi:Fe-S cluster biogenesis protein NfuA
VVLQKIPAGSEVLSTIIVVQRGQVVVKIASACRGCPIGALPADAAAFIKAQIAQAEASGLPKS